MPRLMFVVAAILAAFVLGRATAGSDAAAARVVVKTERSVETVRVGCPDPVAAPPVIEDEPEDPDAVEADQTDVVRVLEEESRRIAALAATQGTLRGTVTDRTTRAVLPGATVVASNDSTPSQAVITGDDGAYQLALDPGTYLVTMYFVDSTVEYLNVTVYARQVTEVHGSFDLPAEVPPMEPDMGITFSGSTALENEYYE